MSGLILSGIGKGISEAGSTFANFMMRDIQDRQKIEDETRRDQRLLDLAEKKSEAESKRDAAQMAQIKEIASEAPINRAATELKGNVAGKIEGESPEMSKEEVAKLIKENPQYLETYKKAGLIGEDKINPDIRRGQDLADAALKIGAHSTVIKAIEASRDKTLSEIKEENRSKQSEANFKESQRHNLAAEETSNTRADAAMKSANAAEARAENAGKDKGSRQERLTTIVNSSNATIKSLNDGSRGRTPEEKADWQQQMDNAIALRNSANKQLKESFVEKESAAPAPATPTATTKPNASNNAAPTGLPKGAIQVGTSNGKAVYETPDGKRYIAK